MTEEQREKYNQYHRDWHKKHPGKSTEYMMRYFAKKIKEMESKTNEK